MVRSDAPSQVVSRDELARRLEAVRAKTLWLLDQVPEEFLRRRVHSFYSPIGWHFGHVGRTEEFWAIGEALGRALLDDHLSFLFADLPENPKDNRVNIPDREGIKKYLAMTRGLVLDALDHADLSSDNPLIRNGYAWDFAIQHECQHQETICEMLCLIQREIGPRELPHPIDWKKGISNLFLPIEGGTFTMGSDSPYAYDNEKQPHEVEVASFQLSKFPVTAYEWSLFMKDQRRVTPESEKPLGFPEYWIDSPEGFFTYGPFGARAVHPDEPVCGISWDDAKEYAFWVGLRLPTEAEWEFVASAGVYPWGDDEPTSERAVFGMNSWSPLPCGSRSAGASPHGVFDLAGQVWEHTWSPFLPYPDYVAYPYDGYSKDHMDHQHRVCRGGSFATAAPILRRTFRNWYVSDYGAGFLGARMAK